MILKFLKFQIITCFLIVGCVNDPQSPLSSDSIEDIYFRDYKSPKNKWGYMDQTGKTVIKPKYDDVRDMKSNITAANLKGKWGFIDKNGEKLIDFKYKQVHDFNKSDDRVVVQDFNNKWVLIDNLGVIIDSLAYNDFKAFAGAYCPVAYNGQWGVMDQSGKEIIAPGYNNLKITEDQLIVKKDKHYGVIDLDGKELIPFEYDRIDFSANMFRIKKDGKYSFYSSENFVRVSPIYNYASHIEDGYFIVKDSDNKYAILDSSFKVILESEAEKIEYANDLIWKYKRNGLWGLMDVNGHEITRPKYELMNKFQEGMILYSINDRWGYLDSTGEIFIPADMPIAWDFKDGLARILLRNGTGFIDKNKTLVIEDKVFEVRDFYNGLARFQTM
jgi:hypothetical protein